jgi:hypothetical protein
MTDAEVRRYFGCFVAVQLVDGGTFRGQLVSGDSPNVPYAVKQQGPNEQRIGLPEASGILAIHAVDDA